MPKIICQMALGPSQLQIQRTVDYHRYFCKQWGYDYDLQLTPVDKSLHPMWQKPRYIQTIIDRGYTDIVWIDADAFWLGRESLDVELDLGTHLGLATRTEEQQGANNGVIFLKGPKDTLTNFINLWIESPDDGRPSRDNVGLDNLLKTGYPWTRLPNKYNSQRIRGRVPPIEQRDYADTNPIIEAWHSIQDRHLIMQNYINDRYQGTLPHFVANWRTRNQLGELARILRTKLFIEVGVFRGEFLLHMAQCSPDTQCIGIDMWRAYTDYMTDPICNQKVLDQAKEKAYQISSRKNVTLLNGKSSDPSLLDKSHLDLSPKMVYIDANHTYEYCKQDIEVWWSKLDSGDILCGHDYSGPPFLAGVKKAVDEFASTHSLPIFTTKQDQHASWLLIK